MKNISPLHSRLPSSVVSVLRVVSPFLHFWWSGSCPIPGSGKRSLRYVFLMQEILSPTWNKSRLLWSLGQRKKKWDIFTAYAFIISQYFHSSSLYLSQNTDLTYTQNSEHNSHLKGVSQTSFKQTNKQTPKCCSQINTFQYWSRNNTTWRIINLFLQSCFYVNFIYLTITQNFGSHWQFKQQANNLASPFSKSRTKIKRPNKEI